MLTPPNPFTQRVESAGGVAMSEHFVADDRELARASG
jgi:hypothetical protein